MSLKAAGAGVPRRRVTLEAGTSFETTFVSGKHVNLMVAHRPPGYHSRPHAHDAEQLNYVQDGEVWFFVGQRGYHLTSSCLMVIGLEGTSDQVRHIKKITLGVDQRFFA